jgi:hypothetical protein
VPGTPPNISRLRLWRVRYPVSQINAGGCVFSEFEGYFAVDFTPAAIPGTPPEEVISVLSLSPKFGGSQLQLVFMGITTLPGGLVSGRGALSGNGVSLPDGEGLSAPDAMWKPELQPDREYCATISSFGRNDQATLPASSNQVCVSVVNIDGRGLPETAPQADAGIDASQGDGGVGGSEGRPLATGGCTVGGGREPAGATGLLVLLLSAVARVRARLRRAGTGRR